MIVGNASSMLVPIVIVLSNWQGNQNLQDLRISRMSEPGFGGRIFTKFDKLSELEFGGFKEFTES